MTRELYILTGQSNAGGNGSLAELPTFCGEHGQPLDAPQPDVLFSLNYHDGEHQNDSGDPLHHGAFGPLVPGQTELNGRHPELFGPEISLLDRLSVLRSAPLALVKYYVNGASLGGPFNANPTADDGGAFRGLINSLDAATAWLAANDCRFEWKGLLWFQGETDAGHQAMAADYQANLMTLIAAVRAHLDRPDLPVVIYQTQNLTGDWTTEVQRAQANVAAADPRIALVDTALQIPNMRDHVHYRAAAHIDFGREGATLIDRLLRDSAV